MKSSALVPTLSGVLLGALCALSAGQPQPQQPAERSWLPRRIQDHLKADRGIRSQGDRLQGGALEKTVVRGDLPQALSAGRLSPISARGTRHSGVGEGLAPLTVEVRKVEYADCGMRGAPIPLYELALPDQGGRNPCEGQTIAGGPDDPTLSPCERKSFARFTGKAMAIPGGFGARGEYVAASADAAFFSFSCMSGVIAKCLRWRYSAGEDLFLACVRAARADFCGTGRSFTCPGTKVDVIDQAGRHLRAQDPTGQVLEADWDRDGAVCLGQPRTPGCGDPAARRRLLEEIAAECRRAGRPLKPGCAESCTDPRGTCGSPVRTYTYPNQTSTCGASQEICPAP